MGYLTYCAKVLQIEKCARPHSGSNAYKSALRSYFKFTFILGDSLMSTIKQVSSGRFARVLCAAALSTLSLGYASDSFAGATFKIDDTKWISLGAGIRSSFTAHETGAGESGNKWSNDFNLDNARLYVNGQVHKYVKFELNTECFPCTGSNGGNMFILDAISKFEITPYFNVWLGRQLVPAERRELNGPFYSATYSIFSQGTPFEPSDYNVRIHNDGSSAGAIGRDDGVNIWGAVLDGHLQYVAGFFRGLTGGANRDHNILYAQRVSYNILDVEKNPGYYTSGTYYGKGGNILTIGGSNQYQEDGAGILGNGSFRGTAVDVLFEKPLANNMGVITVNGEYKNYGISKSSINYDQSKGFGVFEGDAYDASGMYLIPGKIGIGQFQPYVRYVNISPVESSNRNIYEGGLNYIIDGHNARVSLMYQYGDLLNKGNLNFSSGVTGSGSHALTLGFQMQI
jgi:hypothetical protein